MIARLMLAFGAAFVVVGMGLWSLPLAFITAGVALILVALFVDVPVKDGET